MSAQARRQRIAASFGAASSTYDRNADLQARVADSLARRILEAGLCPAPRVLEVGCGTGFLTRALRRNLSTSLFVATDVTSGLMMRARETSRGNLHWAVMDGERPAFLDGAFHLVASSLALQWFADPTAAVEGLKSLVAPGGVLALATLGPASLKEWRHAHERVGVSCGTPDFNPATDYSGMNVVSETIRLGFADGLSFLRTLKGIGATEPREGHRPLSPGTLRRVLDAMGPQPSVSYEIIYLFHKVAA